MKYQVTDKVIYRTIHWTVEGPDDVYYIQCQEDEIVDFWFITSDNEGTIDAKSELGQELREICETYEDFDMDGNDIDE
jgi:hypothetical protein